MIQVVSGSYFQAERSNSDPNWRIMPIDESDWNFEGWLITIDGKISDKDVLTIIRAMEQSFDAGQASITVT